MKLRFVSSERGIVGVTSFKLGYYLPVQLSASEYHFACDELGLNIHLRVKDGDNIKSQLEKIFKKEIEII